MRRPERVNYTQLDDNTYAAIGVYGDAAIKTEDGTENFVCSRSEDGENAAIFVDGDLTINGKGNLTVVGEEAGIYAEGNIAINAPITATATTERGGMAVLAKGITIDSSLDITVPTGGAIGEDGTRIYESDGKTPAANVVIASAAPLTYTVRFNANGGTGEIQDQSFTYGVEQALTANAFTRDRYSFAGWALKADGAAVYADAKSVSNLTDTPDGIVELYAVWSAKPVYSITGKVMTENKTQDVVVPTKITNSVLESSTDTTDVTYGAMISGLDAEAQIVRNSTTGDDKVEVKLTIADQAPATETEPEIKAAQDAIRDVSGGRRLDFMDLTVTKQIGNTAPQTMTQTSTLLELRIPYDMTGKSNIVVYRYHGEEATAMTENPGVNEEGFKLGDDGYLYIYTKNFSTYAVGYTVRSSSSSGSSSSTPGYSVGTPSKIEGGKLTVSPKNAKKGATVTITVTPDDGYELDTLTVKDKNGDKLRVTDKGNGKYTFTMPASKVEIKAAFSKIAPKDQTIVLTIGSNIATVFGETVVNDVAPIARNNRTLLPIRFVAEALGATVDWNADLQKVTISKTGLLIEIYLGQNTAYVGGNAVVLDVTPFAENNRTYLPLRFVAETLGAEVRWEQATQSITIIPA